MYSQYTPPVYSDELMHFGVKGMKWGVRHDRKKGAGRKPLSENAKNIRSERNRKLVKTATSVAKGAYVTSVLRDPKQVENFANMFAPGVKIEMASHIASGIAKSTYYLGTPATQMIAVGAALSPVVYYGAKAVINANRAHQMNTAYKDNK